MLDRTVGKFTGAEATAKAKRQYRTRSPETHPRPPRFCSIRNGAGLSGGDFAAFAAPPQKLDGERPGEEDEAGEFEAPVAFGKQEQAAETAGDADR